MKLKNLALTLPLLAFSPLLAQDTIPADPIAETKISFLDSIKNTFVYHDVAACVDQRWMEELTSQDLFQEMENDIKNIDVNQKVDFDLSTDLLKERLAILNSRSAFHIEYNQGLENIIKHYLKNRKKSYERLMGLSQYYFPMFEEALAKKNVPLEIKYLAIVESALNPRAVSKAGATGLWQFMYGTGKQYNLEINTFVDERSDVLKASEAASQYMINMFKIFGDWDLVLASYNAGPGNVSKAIRRSGGKQNYWNIRPYLPQETQGYVPAFLATMYIFEFHKEHGIVPNKPVANHFATDTIMVKKPMTFKQISDLLDISVAELQFLNPTYKRDHIPHIEGKQNFVRLPLDKVAIFTSNEDKIYAYTEHDFNKREKPFTGKAQWASNTLDTSTVVTKTKMHKVRKGETLGAISKKYGVAMSDVKRWNNLKTNTVPLGRNLKIVTSETVIAKAPAAKTVKPANTALASTDSLKAKTGKAAKEKSDFYVVEKGDDLASIALKHNVTVEELKKWNNLDTDNINYGKQLKLAEAAAESKDEIVFIEHTIQKGDNLSAIARKYNVSVEELKKWNDLEDVTVKLGQVLKVAAAGDGKEAVATVVPEKVTFKPKDKIAAAAAKQQATYLVKKGDSLFSIANKLPGVTVADLKKWNSINGNSIQPGMKLKISG